MEQELIEWSLRDKVSQGIDSMASKVRKLEDELRKAGSVLAQFQRQAMKMPAGAGTHFDAGSQRWRGANGRFTATPPPVIGHGNAFGLLDSKSKNAVKEAGRILGHLFAGAFVAVGVSVAFLAKAYTEYAKFDSLVLALNAVEGSAKKAEISLAQLKEIAKAPGIGFEEAVKGYLQLRRSNLSGGYSQELMTQAANANAIGGGSKENFSSIMLAFSQMAMKPFLAGQELLQLNDAGIGASQMVKDKFGTADTEELKKRGITSAMVLNALVEAMQKMPRVAGGAQNSLDNFSGALHFAMVNLGSGLAGVGPGIDELTKTIEKFSDAGIWADALEGFLNNLGLIPSSAAGIEEALLEVTGSFVGFAAYLKKFNEGAAAFWEWLKDFLPVVQAWEQLTKKDKNGKMSDSGQWLTDAYAYAGAKQEFMDASRAKLADQANKPKVEKEPYNPADSSGDFNFDDPVKDVVKNTAKLVDLQQDSNKLAQMLLGGGAVTSQAFSQTNISRLNGGGKGRGVRAAVDYLVQEIHNELSGSRDSIQSANPLRA